MRQPVMIHEKTAEALCDKDEFYLAGKLYVIVGKVQKNQFDSMIIRFSSVDEPHIEMPGWLVVPCNMPFHIRPK